MRGRERERKRDSYTYIQTDRKTNRQTIERLIDNNQVKKVVKDRTDG